MKKQARAKTKKSSAPKLAKAVPPPDNPLLRHEGDTAARGGGPDEARRAQARARALRRTREMPAADDPEASS